MISLVSLMLTSILAQTLPAQQPNDLSISVQIRTIPLSGRGFGIAGSSRGDEVIARVTADKNFCRAGSGDSRLSVEHDYAWELSGRIVGRTSDTVTAEVTWKQLEGPDPMGAPKSQVVTLRSGERAVLETMRPATSTPCAAEAVLEIEAGSRIRFPAGVTAAAGGIGGRSTGGGGGTGRGGPAGGLSTSPVGAAAGGSGAAAAPAGTGRGFELRDPANMAPAALLAGVPFSVEIWLVHTLPNGVERVEAHDRAENINGVTKKFGPVSIAGQTGAMSLTVGVDLRTFARNRNPLSILINREETINGKVGHGGTSRVSEIPADTEIISLELPTSSAYQDRFSIRLKFTKPSKEISGGLFH